MTVPRLFVIAALLVAATCCAVQADDTVLRAVIAKFADAKNFSQTERVVNELAATGETAVVPALSALSDGNLYFRKSDKKVFVIAEAEGGVELRDPMTGEKSGKAGKRELTKIKVNNSLRRLVRDSIGGLTLNSKNPETRAKAAATLTINPDAETLPLIESAIAKETDAAVKAKLEQARASAILVSERPDAEKAKAIDTIASLGTRDSVSLLLAFGANAKGKLKSKAEKAVREVNDLLALWDMGQNVWYGFSLGSVLLLAAVGLAITFGVMGVINMAHGEMVMLGAYTTFVVQDIIRSSAPVLFDWSLIIAVPLAFLVSGTVGLVLERGIIRFLYGRPLETLLATWGVSLMLQQAVRTIFGPTNREVGNPSWMSGAFNFGEMTITWNRLCIVIFALTVFTILLWTFNKTPLGLRMRAVTQNRRMASAMGIRTPWVDALTFALGSGIAGMAGVALSQIDNVSPNLGQSYIIDSFMVVVFGGVGNLWGTLVGAFSLGIVNKFLEPYAGAVLGKIVVLVVIILFIQKRPRGLFALKGRAVDA